MKEIKIEHTHEKKKAQCDQRSLLKNWINVKNHPLEQVIGDVKEGVKTRKAHNEFQNHYAFISQIEPKNVLEAIEDESWMLSM